MKEGYIKERYNKKERLGIYKVGAFITEYTDWVFREQPIVDVGFDGKIEETKKGDPKGVFIAIQIKSGDSNYYINKDKTHITYYMTKTHYNYWEKSILPVMLILVSNEFVFYWANVIQDNITKTREGWKITIPVNQTLTESNISNVFTEVVHSRFPQKLINNKLNQRDIEVFIDRLNMMEVAAESLKIQTNSIKYYYKNIRKLQETYSEYSKEGVSKENKKFTMLYSRFALHTNIFGKRLDSEIHIFKETYITGLEVLVKYHPPISLVKRQPAINVILIKEVIEEFLLYKKTLYTVNTVIKNLPEMNDIKKSKIYAINVTLNLISEIKTTLELYNKLLILLGE